MKSVKNDPKSPLSTYFCELCDCFFNDDLARIMHCKGRRHRLNYKVSGRSQKVGGTRPFVFTAVIIYEHNYYCNIGVG